jgi:hypothetical protein
MNQRHVVPQHSLRPFSVNAHQQKIAEILSCLNVATSGGTL